jgi:hypothetical protein
MAQGGKQTEWLYSYAAYGTLVALWNMALALQGMRAGISQHSAWIFLLPAAPAHWCLPQTIHQWHTWCQTAAVRL